MALPTQRRNKAAKGRRRSQHHLKKIGLIPCPHCQRQIFPHRVCPFCGYYKGQLVLSSLANKKAKQNKKSKPTSADTKKKPTTGHAKVSKRHKQAK